MESGPRPPAQFSSSLTPLLSKPAAWIPKYFWLVWPFLVLRLHDRYLRGEPWIEPGVWALCVSPFCRGLYRSHGIRQGVRIWRIGMDPMSFFITVLGPVFAKSLHPLLKHCGYQAFSRGRTTLICYVTPGILWQTCCHLNVRLILFTSRRA